MKPPRPGILLLARLHLGYVGLWVMSLSQTLGLALVGGDITLDGTGVTSSAPWNPGRNFAHSLGVPTRDAIHAWGIAMMLIGLTATLILCAPVGASRTRPLMLRKGGALLAVALVWVLWAGMFGVYALGHSGLGLVGATTWGVIAISSLAGALTWTGYAMNPRPRSSS